MSAYLLDEGRVSAKAGGSGRKIRIETRGTDAVAETDSGRFDVTSTGTGHVAIASDAGSVQVTAHGKSVDVPAGTQTFVTAGSVPSTPTKIPASLILKVSAAGGGRDRSAALRGETAPGAIVSINGVRSAADDHGHFDSKVALKTGDNVIVVVVEDATGRSQKQLTKKSFEQNAARRSRSSRRSRKTAAWVTGSRSRSRVKLESTTAPGIFEAPLAIDASVETLTARVVAGGETATCDLQINRSHRTP